jgi:cytochrome c oxidase subunit 4
MKTDHTASHHIVSLRTYTLIFAALLLLLVLTIAVYYFNLGIWSIVIGIAIAVVKALLIILFFMHVRYSSRLTKLFVAAAFIWLAILMVGTMHDYISRGWLPPPSPPIESQVQSP